jgi:hypothetical protein
VIRDLRLEQTFEIQRPVQEDDRMFTASFEWRAHIIIPEVELVLCFPTVTRRLTECPKRKKKNQSKQGRILETW